MKEMRTQRLGAVAVALVMAAAGHLHGNVQSDGLYHNNTNLNARAEALPVQLVPGRTNYFLEVNAAATNVTVYFLTAHPAGEPGEDVYASARFWSNREDVRSGFRQTNIVLAAGVNRFHGTPLTGSVTVELWRVDWKPPHGFTGSVSYAPQIVTRKDDSTTDIRYLVRSGVDNGSFWQTNAQAIATASTGVDYSFAWTQRVALSFSGVYFNNPAAGLPQNEQVPGLGGVHFLEYSHLPDQPSHVYLLTPEDGITACRTRFWLGAAWGDVILAGAWHTSVEVSASQPFHGYPASGSASMDVWRAEFYAPNRWPAAGESMRYATEIDTPSDGTVWLTPSLTNQTDGVAVTNDWPLQPQQFSSYSPAAIPGHDWSFAPTATMKRAESLSRDWAYHNHPGLAPSLETLPGLVALPFLQISYLQGKTFFRLLADRPINRVPGETPHLEVSVQSAYDGSTTLLPMNWTAGVTIGRDAPFHGLPAAQAKTLDVWNAEWPHPTNASGFVTNPFDVSYAILLKTTFGSSTQQTDHAWLLASSQVTNGWGSNNYPLYPQRYGQGNVTGYGYHYTHRWRQEGDLNGNSVPDWWEEYYFPGEVFDPDGDLDDDRASNLREYIADTDPTKGESVLLNPITNVAGPPESVVSFTMGPLTSPLRVYDLWWKTNLLDELPWQPLGLNVPGAYDRSPITLTVTNACSEVFYKTGVRVP